MFTANLLPGQGFQPLTIYHAESTVTATGRATGGTTIAPTDKKVYGMITSANEKEKEEWKQNGHPVTHKVIQYGAEKKAKATDYLVAEDGRQFYVQGTKNHGDLNVSVTYYVEERKDIRKRTE